MLAAGRHRCGRIDTRCSVPKPGPINFASVATSNRFAADNLIKQIGLKAE